MESRIERKRSRIFRIIAWSISIALHMALLYFVLVYDGQNNNELSKETVVLSDPV
ncbi:MAG: hypothetical protein HKN76_17740 [Saprospiraceae bacterium]|nr:hypothetical protein [Saprospiraceae bacterium]